MTPKDRLLSPSHAVISSQKSNAEEAESGVDPIRAMQGRFPTRSTHNVHVKRRLEANPSLAGAKADSLATGGGSKGNLLGASRLKGRGSGSATRRRPKTGTVRGGVFSFNDTT